MNENLQIVFGLMGGLALFLFGMNSMSDALQKAAGERMKKILGFLTRNPIMGALAGALVTAVLQSSSATTVMVIGFVSAGLMSLPQAISVIFGANIGTTMTAQLMAFKISNYIYPIIFVGFILFFVFKNEKVQSIGRVLFSFGVLFEGIEIMGGVMKPLASSPIFVDMMGRVTDLPVLGVVLGMVMTLLVQSSSATIAVLQNFASQAGPDGVSSIIGLAGAIPILLGDNIGTTITALIASIGQSKNAKRTAIAHSVFNITGSVVCLFFIPLLVKFVTFISPKGDEIAVISRQIANAHTTFNIACTLIWLPLIPVMVKIVCFIIRGSDKMITADHEVKYLDEAMLGQPVSAMYMISKEMKRLSEQVMVMLSSLSKVVTGRATEEAVFECNSKADEIITLQNKIQDYVSKLFARGSLTEQQAEQTAGLLFVSDNMERIALRCEDFSHIYEKVNNKNSVFSDEAVTDLDNYIGECSNLFSDSIASVERGDTELAAKVENHNLHMKKTQRKLNKAHLFRVQNKSCDPKLTSEYAGLLYCLDRIADCCVGIAEEAMDDVTFVELEEGAYLTDGK